MTLLYRLKSFSKVEVLPQVTVIQYQRNQGNLQRLTAKKAYPV